MTMTQEHKDALAQGRKESRAIKAYLAALQSKRPGRPVTKEGLESKLGDLEARIQASDDPLATVELIQARIDTEDALANLAEVEDFDRLQEEFIANVVSYSSRKGISYTAWREFGVPAAILREAGVRETRRR